MNYRVLSLDAGLKYRGFFLQTEYYNRWLDGYEADAPLPASEVHDTGFYVQGAFFPVPKKLEVYTATSQIFGDKSAGFSNSSKYSDGFHSDGVKVQFSFKYNFSHKLGANGGRPARVPRRSK